MTTVEPAQRVALVTGAGRRIGRAIALALAADGYRVGVHVNRSRKDGDAVAAEIAAGGGTAAVLDCDLGGATAAEDIVARCRAALGHPTCLVNNASAFDYDDLASMTAASWTRHLDVNLRAPVFLAQAMARDLPQSVTGNVINLVDQRVLRPTPEFFSYGVSKAALWEATRLMAQALAPRVRVNGIAPGPVLASIHQTADDFDAERRATLLARGTSPDEIVDAVRFLLDAPAVTGQMIALDGGQHLTFETASRYASRLPGAR